VKLASRLKLALRVNVAAVSAVAAIRAEWNNREWNSEQSFLAPRPPSTSNNENDRTSTCCTAAAADDDDDDDDVTRRHRATKRSSVADRLTSVGSSDRSVRLVQSRAIHRHSDQRDIEFGIDSRRARTGVRPRHETAPKVSTIRPTVTVFETWSVSAILAIGGSFENFQTIRFNGFKQERSEVAHRIRVEAR